MSLKGAIDKYEFVTLLGRLFSNTSNPDVIYDGVKDLVRRVEEYDSIVETADILSDKETMAAIAEAQAERPA